MSEKGKFLPEQLKLVFDVNVYIGAVEHMPRSNSFQESFADPSKHKANQLGFSERIAISCVTSSVEKNKSRYQMFSSEHILYEVAKKLVNKKGWTESAASSYIAWLETDVIGVTGGDPYFETDDQDYNRLTDLLPNKLWKSATGNPEADLEDARVVALVNDSGATLLVTEDVDLQKAGRKIGYVDVVSVSFFNSSHLQYLRSKQK